MENRWRMLLIVAIAPVTWASTYPVIHYLLPDTDPITTALVRALPAGILLLAVVRTLPRGSWWWRSIVLGLLNVAGFFVLLTIAAQRLASSVATVMTTAGPVLIILLAWVILRERPTTAAFVGAGTGALGVVLLVGSAFSAIDPVGVVAILGAMLSNALGSVLTRRWSDSTPLIALTAWQLGAGGLVLLPIALAVDGVMAVPDRTELAAYAWISIVATAIGFLAWFAGLRALPAQQVGLVGLLNPVTGVLVGTLVAGERLAPAQWIGVGVVITGVVVGQLGHVRKRRNTPDTSALVPSIRDC